MISGYSHRYRVDLVKGVLSRYHQLEQEVQEGKRRWYRSRKEISEQKLSKGGNSAATWFLTEEITQTLFLQITPDSQLVKNMKEKLADLRGPDGGKTKVVEQGGSKVLSGLMPADPFRKPECRWQEVGCMVDHTKHDCMDTGAIYKISCKLCTLGDKQGGSYIGQSGHTLHARQSEHGAGVKNSLSTCPLVRHAADQHPEENITPADFLMKKLMSTKDNMTRLIGEGEAISNQEAEGYLLWNSKGEYGKSKVVRWTPTVSQI